MHYTFHCIYGMFYIFIFVYVFLVMYIFYIFQCISFYYIFTSVVRLVFWSCSQYQNTVIGKTFSKSYHVNDGSRMAEYDTK